VTLWPFVSATIGATSDIAGETRVSLGDTKIIEVDASVHLSDTNPQ